MDKLVVLSRDCEALQIPSAEKIQLRAGMYVRIMQALGGSFTVLTDDGMMARIDGKDADALGEQKTEAAPPAPSSAEPETDPSKVVERIWDALRTCYDPEIPVNIVDLGLVYECKVESAPEGLATQIRFTLTAPGCGMGDVLKADIESKVLAIPGILSASVEVVFEPPWDREMMSEAAKLQLGMY